jgi:ubiquinone/menaquinone biosynthesis C-methylase UbiE
VTTVPSPQALRQAVSARYDALACCAPGRLSCGSALDLAAPAPGEVLLDLGCGSGKDVVRAAGRVGRGGLAVGVDLSEEMLLRARRSVPPFLANACFVRSDLVPLELPDACAEVVVSNCVINHAPDKGAVYREIHRVLVPGGRFVVSDVVAERELPDHVRADPAAWAACYGGAIPEGEYLAAIRGAGFGEVEILERSEPYQKSGVTVLSLTVKGTKR